jgi:hypothetical protein
MRLGDKGCEAADLRSEDSGYQSRVIEFRNLPHRKEASVVPKTGAAVNRDTRAGHLSGITFNFKSLERFFLRIREIWYKWLNRRSDKRSLYWWQYLMYLKANPLPYPRIVHPKA